MFFYIIEPKIADDCTRYLVHSHIFKAYILAPKNINLLSEYYI